MSERLYAQYQPDAESLAWLLALQQDVYEANPDSRRMPADQIHLTIIHFGILDEVYKQICEVTPGLTKAMYRSAVAQFVQDASKAMTTHEAARVDKLELFGFTSKTLVVTLEETPGLHAVHAASLNALQHFFRSCGVNDPKKFMAENQNFQYALTLKPHITLLKNAPVLTDILVEPKILQLRAMPILYD